MCQFLINPILPGIRSPERERSTNLNYSRHFEFNAFIYNVSRNIGFEDFHIGKAGWLP